MLESNHQAAMGADGITIILVHFLHKNQGTISMLIILDLMSEMPSASNGEDEEWSEVQKLQTR